MKSILEAIQNFFGSAWHDLLTYLHAAIPEATAVLLRDLLQVADPIVADLQNQQLTNEQKRDQAVSLLQGKAIQAGWDVGVSLIHTAIELAVQKLKTSQPAPAAAEAPAAGNEGVMPEGNSSGT